MCIVIKIFTFIEFNMVAFMKKSFCFAFLLVFSMCLHRIQIRNPETSPVM